MNPWTALLVGALIGYVLGSIPASYVAGRLLRGIDLRDHGSGNLGATNVYRTLGWKAAVPVLAIDIAKGSAAVAVGLYLLPSWSTMPDLTALVCAVTAILGHGFSPFVGFKGGKGVATAAGAFIALTPVATLSAIFVWAVLLVATRIMSVASVAAAAVLPVNLLVFELLQRGGEARWATMIFGTLIAVWVILRHRGNLERLREGKESTLW
ncbi:MAG TPA: glycerol-3-phosphate 1-O-acyltransferase PlsY [Candidatus Krumholzibacteria bacterium]|nr:glycerol-3-phosphate 1-O-acyltransferase PlsY [Candidatus Krumholzibacteria bacterium]